MTTKETFKEIYRLALDAKCLNDDDWGSERQVNAEMLFWNSLETEIVIPPDYVAQMHMTTEESIDWGIGLLMQSMGFKNIHIPTSLQIDSIDSGSAVYQVYDGIMMEFVCGNPCKECINADQFADRHSICEFMINGVKTA